MKNKSTQKENAIQFLTELVAFKRKWTPADRSRYNRLIRFIKAA